MKSVFEFICMICKSLYSSFPFRFIIIIIVVVIVIIVVSVNGALDNKSLFSLVGREMLVRDTKITACVTTGAIRNRSSRAGARARVHSRH